MYTMEKNYANVERYQKSFQTINQYNTQVITKTF